MAEIEKCPWMGFKQYEEADSDIFQGRDTEIAEILSLIGKSDIAVCYAQSGAGKSSLIKGGLYRRFRQLNMFPVPVLYNFSEAEESQAISLDKVFTLAFEDAINTFNEQKGKERKIKYVWELAQDGVPEEVFDSLWWKLRKGRIGVYVDDIRIAEATPIFVLDQFERIFTHTKSEQQRLDFFSFVKELVINRAPKSLAQHSQFISENYDETSYEAPFKLLLSLREEYIGRLDYYATTQIPIPSIVSNKFFLSPLSIDGAMKVITRQNVTVLNSIADDIIAIAKDNQQVSPILLSVVCRSLYEQAAKNADGTLKNVTKEEVEKKKSLIIENYYKSQVKKTGIPARVIRTIENILVDENGTRKLVELETGKLNKMRFAEKYKQCLVDYGIIRIDRLGRSTFVELIHDRVAETIAARKSRYRQRIKMWLVSAVVVIVSLVAVGYAICYAVGKKKEADIIIESTSNPEVEISFELVGINADGSVAKCVEFGDDWEINIRRAWYDKNDSLHTDTVTRKYTEADKPIQSIKANIISTVTIVVDFKGDSYIPYDNSMNKDSVYDAIRLNNQENKIPVFIKRKSEIISGRAVAIYNEDTLPIINAEVYCRGSIVKTNKEGEFILRVPICKSQALPVIDPSRSELSLDRPYKQDDKLIVYKVNDEADSVLTAKCQSIAQRYKTDGHAYYHRFYGKEIGVNMDVELFYFPDYNKAKDDASNAEGYFRIIRKSGTDDVANAYDVYYGHGSLEKYDKEGLRNIVFKGRNIVGNEITLCAYADKDTVMNVDLIVSDKDRLQIQRIKGLSTKNKK